MAYDDEIDEEYDDEIAREDNNGSFGAGDFEDVMQSAKKDLDPFNLSDPESAFLFLSDDAQDEIEGTGPKKMKCRSCGHVFRSELHDDCPRCFSSDVRETG